MIGTFMLEALRGAADVQTSLARLNSTGRHAMVLVSSRANVSSGLTEGTNWLVLFLKAASGFSHDRIDRPLCRRSPLARSGATRPADLAYYVQRVWGPLYYRKVIFNQVFAGIPTISPDRPPLPGHYVVTPPARSISFMIRMKHSPRCARDAVQYGRVLDGAGTGERELDAGARYSRRDHRFPGGVAGYPEDDVVAAVGRSPVRTR